MTPPPTPSPRRAAPPTRRQLRSHPAVRNYTLFCLASLFLLVVCLADRGLGWWCLLPALVGGVALLGHWSFGPPLVLVSLVPLLLSGSRYRWGPPSWARNQVPTMMDLVLCAAVLGYAMAHYRLLSLVRHVFPPDPRRPADGPRADAGLRRSADLVSGWEMALLAVALPLTTGAALLTWYWVMEDVSVADLRRVPLLQDVLAWYSVTEGVSAFGIPIDLWRALRIVWAVLAVVAVATVVAGYVRQVSATPEEALVYLQDQLWRQTRREQASLNRWLAWARLRSRRREEAR